MRGSLDNPTCSDNQASLTNPRLEAALRYAGLGLSVIPAGKNKRPLVEWKSFQTTPADQRQIRDWWEQWPTANVALATGCVSNLYVVDFDVHLADQGATRDGKAGDDTRRRMELHDALLACGGPFVETPRGRHLYFRGRNGLTPGNGAGLLPKVDFRGDGGYVIAPPSANESGDAYSFGRGRGLGEVGLPELPQAVLDLLGHSGGVATLAGARKTLAGSGTLGDALQAGPARFESPDAWAKAAMDRECGQLVRSPEGQRNDALNRAAFNLGQLVGGGYLREADVAAELLRTAARIGLSEAEARATLRSGLEAGKAKPRHPAPRGEALGARRAGEAANDSWRPPAPVPADPFEGVSLDRSLLKRTMLPAPAFPLDVLGPYKRHVERFDRETGFGPDYMATAILAAFGAVLARTRWAGVDAGWTAPPVLWCVLVGNPSAGKTPSLGPALTALRKVENGRNEGFAEKKRAWETQKKLADWANKKWLKDTAEARAKGGEPPKPLEDVELPPCPVPYHIVFQDTTIEAMAIALQETGGTALRFSDEMQAFLSMGRYAKGEAAQGDSAFWREAFNGGGYRSRRVIRDSVTLPRVAVGVLGGIQPGPLHDCLVRATDDGLADRFLYCWPDTKPLPDKRPKPEGAMEFVTLEDGMGKLSVLAPMNADHPDRPPIPRFVPLTEDARDALYEFRKWCQEQEARLQGKLVGHVGKYPGYAARLALVLEFMWWAGGDGSAEEPKTVSLAALQAAIRLLKEYFLPMARRAFREAGLPTEERNAQIVARWLVEKRKGASAISVRELDQYRVLPGADSKARDAALARLVEAGWLASAFSRHGDTKGRVGKSYAVNPAVWEEAPEPSQEEAA